MICTGGTCQGSLPSIPNGVYGTLQGDAATSSAPAVGTIVEVMCDPGYEQTRGLPYYACQGEGQTASWSGELLDTPPLCEREYLNTTTL